MPRLSIIIAAPSDSVALEETLLSVLENRPDDCEILVAHPSTYGDPYALAGEIEFVALSPGSDALQCWRQGLAQCRGEIIHFLRAGCVVESGWATEAMLLFADRKTAAVSPVVFDRNDRNRLVGVGISDGGGMARHCCGARQMGGSTLIQRLKPLGPLLDASFYRKGALDAIGGLSTEVGEQLADLDLARSLTTLGFRHAVASECRIYMPALSVQRSAYETGKESTRLFLRHVSPRSWWSGVLRHAGRIAFDACRNPLVAPFRWCGHLAALAEMASHREFQSKLDQAAEELLSTVRLESVARTHRMESAHRAPHSPISSTSEYRKAS